MDANSNASFEVVFWIVALTTFAAISWAVWKRRSRNHPLILELARRAREFSRSMAEKYPNDARMQAFAQDVETVQFERSIGNAGYSVNKGERIAVCVDDGITNDTIFVMLHELAHIYTQDWGHTEKYWANFAMLLREAETTGLWTRVNYAKVPSRVCRDRIDFTPR